jgi:hypothetical protein
LETFLESQERMAAMFYQLLKFLAECLTLAEQPMTLMQRAMFTET